MQCRRSVVEVQCSGSAVDGGDLGSGHAALHAAVHQRAHSKADLLLLVSLSKQSSAYGQIILESNFAHVPLAAMLKLRQLSPMYSGGCCPVGACNSARREAKCVAPTRDSVEPTNRQGRQNRQADRQTGRYMAGLRHTDCQAIEQTHSRVCRQMRSHAFIQIDCLHHGSNSSDKHRQTDRNSQDRQRQTGDTPV